MTDLGHVNTYENDNIDYKRIAGQHKVMFDGCLSTMLSRGVEDKAGAGIIYLKMLFKFFEKHLS